MSGCTFFAQYAFIFSLITLMYVSPLDAVQSQNDMYAVYGGYSFCSDSVISNPSSKAVLAVHMKAGRYSITTKQLDGLIGTGATFCEASVLRHRRWRKITTHTANNGQMVIHGMHREKLGRFYEPFQSHFVSFYESFSDCDAKLFSAQKNEVLPGVWHEKCKQGFLSKNYSIITRKLYLKAECKFCLRYMVNGKMRIKKAVPVHTTTYRQNKHGKDIVVTKAVVRLDLRSHKTSEILFKKNQRSLQLLSIKGAKPSSIWYRCIKKFCKKNMDDFAQFVCK